MANGPIRNAKGFTLTELTLVMAIVSTVTVSLLGAGAALQKSAKFERTMDDLSSIAQSGDFVAKIRAVLPTIGDIADQYHSSNTAGATIISIYGNTMNLEVASDKMVGVRTELPDGAGAMAPMSYKVDSSAYVFVPRDYGVASEAVYEKKNLYGE